MECVVQHKRPLAMILLLVFTCLTVSVPPAQARLISTGQVVNGDSPEAERARLKAFLAREEVQVQLASWGLDKTMAKARVDRLTDEEVTRMVQKLDQLPAGGDGVFIVAAATVFVFLVLLFTDILGYTDIFPFVKKYP